MAVTVFFSWDYLGALREIRGWHIYLSERSEDKGRAIGCCVPPEPRKATVDVEEGTWFLRAVPVGPNMAEAPDWQNCPAVEVFATGREQTPVAPVRADAAFVEPGASLRAIVQPVSMETQPGQVEVVALPADVAITHASQGRLLATFRTERADLIDQDPFRALGNMLPLEGALLADGETRRLALRVISDTGQPGPSVERSVVKPPRLGLKSTTLASILASTGAHAGFPAAPTAEAFEYGAGYGARLLYLPTADTIPDALMMALWHVTPFATNGRIRTDELDLGAIKTVVLEFSDEVHRADRYGAWATETLEDLASTGRLSPSDDPVTRRSVESPEWLWREIFADGTPRRPIRPENARWVYWISDTSPVDTTEGFDDHFFDPSYFDTVGLRREYVPGAWVRGKFVVAELRLHEPLGMHRLQTGDVRVVAREAIDVGGASGIKERVRFAVNGYLPAYIATPTTLTAVAPATLSPDGFAAAVGDRIVVPFEGAFGGGGSAVDNGIYVVTVNDGISPWVLTRPSDADSPGDLNGGDSVQVQEGTVFAGWNLFLDAPAGIITPGTTAQTWRREPGRLVRRVYLTGVGTYFALPGVRRGVWRGRGAGAGGGGAWAGPGAAGAGGGAGGGYAEGEFADPDWNLGIAYNVPVAGGLGGPPGAAGLPGADATFGPGITIRGGLPGAGALNALVRALQAGGTRQPVPTVGGTVNVDAIPGQHGDSDPGAGFAIGGIGGSGDEGGGGDEIIAIGGVSFPGVAATGAGAGGGGAACGPGSVIDQPGGPGAPARFVIDEFS